MSNAKYFQNIINTVRIVKARISDYENDLWEYMKDIDNKSRRDKLENKAKELHTSAIELMGEAAKSAYLCKP